MVNSDYCKTPVAASLLGISYPQMLYLLRGGRFSPLPEKDSSGDYIWTEADLERARKALATIKKYAPRGEKAAAKGASRG